MIDCKQNVQTFSGEAADASIKQCNTTINNGFKMNHELGNVVMRDERESNIKE
jgi:hypothetical protein